MRKLLVLIADVFATVALFCIGAHLQTTLHPPSWLSVLFLLPAMLYAWKRIPLPDIRLSQILAMTASFSLIMALDEYLNFKELGQGLRVLTIVLLLHLLHRVYWMATHRKRPAAACSATPEEPPTYEP